MTLSTEERTKKVYELKNHWLSLFQAHGLEDRSTYFYPKPLMKTPSGELYMLWFPKELEKKQDLYTEVVDFSINPEAQRKLYKLKANNFYATEYELTDTRIGQQYVIPFAEFVEVKLPEFSTAPKVVMNLTLDDAHADSLTARDWACIHLAHPMSNKPWLNELIIDSVKSKTKQ